VINEKKKSHSKWKWNQLAPNLVLVMQRVLLKNIQLCK
jgi:hypothetical protein